MTNRFSRRELIQSLCGGIGAVGLSALLSEQVGSAATLGLYTGPRLPVKAKHVICLFMTGGPSHVDLFDPKPALVKYQGQRPGSVDLRTERQTAGLMPSPFEFKNFTEETRTVVGESLSSTRTLPPASISRRETHGSTVQTASIFFC